jgi:hypothetical protein
MAGVRRVGGRCVYESRLPCTLLDRLYQEVVMDTMTIDF